MKKLLIMIAAVGMMGTAQAQMTTATAEKTKVERAERKSTPEERAKYKTERMTKELSLDERQQKEVYEVTLEQMKNMERVRTQREESRSKAIATRDNANKKIAEVLNEEQRAIWEKKKAAHQEKRVERRSESREGAQRSEAAPTSTAKKNCSKECSKSCTDKKK